MDALDNNSGARLLFTVDRALGFWPKQPRGRWPWLRPLLIHVPGSFLFVSLMYLELLRSKTLEELGEVVYISLTETAMLVKIFNIWHMNDVAQRYIAELATNRAYRLRNATERVAWQREQRKFHQCTIFYVGLSLGVVISSNLGVLWSAAYELPFAIWLPFEWRCRVTYWYAYAYDCVCMLLTCISNSSLDMVYCYFLLQLALLYKLLGQRLLTLQQAPQAVALKELRDIFKLHQSVRSLTHQCEKLISAPILSQIVLSALVLCFSGYRLQNLDIVHNIGAFVAMAQYLAAMTLQIFLPCYYANEVNLHADSLMQSAYSTNWVDYSPRARKLLIIYMEFLKRPTRIRAGHFFEVDLPIFSKTMNNAYSFFAVLLNMSKDDEDNARQVT